MATRFSSAPASPSFRRVPFAAAGVPPNRPAPPVDRRPLPPEPPRRALELAWLAWQTPAALRDEIIINLRQTLNWRAQFCGPIDPPEEPAGRSRFGLLGEALWPEAVDTVLKKVRQELREIIRTLEESQPRLVRNWLLAMHSVRLSQLCAELEQRDLDALETLRDGLSRLWV